MSPFLRTLFSSLIAMTILIVAGCSSEGDPSQRDNSWFRAGQEKLAEMQKRKPIHGPAKNVILFIADGHGITSNTALRILDGQRQGMSGEEHILSYEHFPNLALSKTYNTDAQVPDSAGTATAILSGIKTRIGVLGVDESVERGDCQAVAGGSVTSLFESAERVGMATGIVTTARLTHATPAAAYAHSADRKYEDDSKLSDEQLVAGCIDIADQFVRFESKSDAVVDGIDVAFAGGRRHFLPSEGSDGAEKGRRSDGRNLINEWQQRFPSGQYVTDREGFDDLDSQLPVLGLFADSHMSYEVDRGEDEPSIAEMTGRAIKLLSERDEGYLLMVEGARIDHGHHINSAHRALEDGRAFNEAVATAVAMTDAEETLIIVTADHSHTLSFSGYPSRGNPILGLTKEGDRTNLAEDGQPYTTLGYMNGPSAHSGQRPDLSGIDTLHKDFRHPSLVPLNIETHGGEDVAIYAQGPEAWLFDGTVEQNYIYHVIFHAAQLDEQR